MGGTRWSDDHYHDRAAYRAATKTDAFAYDTDVKTGKVAAAVHDKLNPKGVKLREARDSDVHPESLAIAVLFDVTGSMQTVPRILQQNLPKLMGLLIRKGYVEHPAIMVGGIGDATCDTAPLQVGQFESGIEIENDLTNIYLEGAGGGQDTESYELAMYFVARHTVADCYEKRGKKGYLFVIGDERPYDNVNKSQVKNLIGDDLEASIAIKDILNELDEKWNVYVVIPRMTSHWEDKSVHDKWRNLVGQNYLKLEDPAGICELIASVVGVAEGKVDLEDVSKDLVDAGSSKAVALSVSKALVTVAEGKAAKGSVIKAPDSGVGSGVVTL